MNPVGKSTALALTLALTAHALGGAAYWQEIGGISTVLKPTSINPPGTHSWNLNDPYGGQTPPTGENFFLELAVSNTIPSATAYIEQVLDLPYTLSGDNNGQQFLFYALPTGAAAYTDGVWVEITTNGGGYSYNEWTSLDTEWNQATEGWMFINFGTSATQATVKIGVLRPDGVTTGTRTAYIDSAFVHSWYGQFDWENYKFEISDNPTILINESDGSTDVSEQGSTTDTYTIRLDGPTPTSMVRVIVDPDTQTGVNGGPAGTALLMDFTTDWETPRTITVRAIDDDYVEGYVHPSVITHTSSSSDPNYNNVSIQSVIANITDNDTRTCYDPCAPGLQDADTIDLTDFAWLAANWLKPYDNKAWQRRPLPFRAILTMPCGYQRWDPPLTSTAEWNARFDQWSAEGFNALVYWIGCELFGGSHNLIQIEDYPEARHLTSSQVQANINNFTWALDQGKQHGFENYLYTVHIYYTQNFATAHGLPSSGERSELTRAYTESVYAEYCRTYPDLDGFYGPMGESLPDRRSEWFAQAIVPGLTCTGGRENTAPKPRFIVHQWETPLEDYIEDIAAPGVYSDTWLALHAYNGEQITDAEPWPFVVKWARETALPTVVMLYPANIFNFIFNSPEFAYEIANEIKKIPNIKGFVYMEWSGRKLSPLFRKALAYYASTDAEYSDEPWLDNLEAEYGNRTAAEHFLQAFKCSGRILPDKDALFFCPHDNLKRELNMPYAYWQLTSNRPWNWQTSRVRGNVLVPVWHYAAMIAQNASFEGRNGSEVPGHQYPVFRTDGGSSFDVIPPTHMASIRERGQQAYDEATLGRNAATLSQTKAEHMQRYMKGYKLLSKYFETKVAATVEAFIAAKNNSPTREANAQALANQAYNEWVAFYNFCMTENPKLNDLAQYYNGENLHEVGMGQETMADLLAEELNDKNNIGSIFGW